MEAITGLSLITWPASFMFVEMIKFLKEQLRTKLQNNLINKGH
tara:strand:- start:460 stop:588 length:129 start_codon:yes stop_codon:yes gene_type:complete